MRCSECKDEAERFVGEKCVRCYGRLYKREARKDPQTRERRRRNDRERYNERKSELADYRKQRTQELKLKVFARLGGRCNWPGCPWTDHRALQIDHVRDDGSLERRLNGRDQSALYLRVLRCKDVAEKYQLLCANHNWVKRAEKV